MNDNLHEFQGDVEPGSVGCLYCKEVEKVLEPKLSAEVAELKIIPNFFTFCFSCYIRLMLQA